MKLKNIPADISAKSIKDAQNEVYEILKQLENTDADLENSMEHYNRINLILSRGGDVVLC